MAIIPSFKIGLWNAWIFMGVFLLQMLVIMIIGKHVRERSHVPAEARHNKCERSIGIIGNFVWLLALGYSIFMPFQLGSAWFYTGLFIFILGLIFLTDATLKFINTPTDQLITKGVYRFSRHPMYLATFFICLGSGIAAASWLFLLLSIIMAICFYQEALIEERFCLDKYHNAYRTYMKSVPRWLGVTKSEF